MWSMFWLDTVMPRGAWYRSLYCCTALPTVGVYTIGIISSRCCFSTA